jgi:hypothetical protein
LNHSNPGHPGARSLLCIPRETPVLYRNPTHPTRIVYPTCQTSHQSMLSTTSTWGSCWPCPHRL